ncbi:MAG: triose-phosphate isomerase [Candidatus Uhrbacteria bacterium]|nr:triose-phosphate isomerase [Candidatus Uhrbacteria bacterium]
MKTIIANWKMNLGVRESVAQARGVLRILQGKEVLPTIVLCPSFTALAEVRKVTVRSHVELGAQNVGPNHAGAYTGEVSAQQLEDVGAHYVIIGHSERRTRFHEDDGLISDRLTATFAAGLTPILCVGEDAATRERGEHEAFVAAQVMRAFRGVDVSNRAQVIIAYEPIWAIGTGTSAEPADVLAMHRIIREAAASLKLSDRLHVVYGGSVDGTNAYRFLREPEVDGVLVGGASLKIHEFEGIVGAACDVIAAQQL